MDEADESSNRLAETKGPRKGPFFASFFLHRFALLFEKRAAGSGAWHREAVPGTAYAASAQLVERDRPGHRDVQRLSPCCGIDACTSQRSSTSGGSPSRSAPRTKTTSPSSSSSASGVPPCGTSATRRPLGFVERQHRHAEQRAHRRAQRLRPGRIRAAARERDTGAERIRRAQQRPDVSRDRTRARARASPAARRAAGPRAGRRRSRAADAQASTPPRAATPRRSPPRRADRRARRPPPPRRDPHPPRRTTQACRASAGHGACGRA